MNGVPAPIFYASPTQLNVQVPYWVGSGSAVVGVTFNGASAGYPLQITAAAPAILADSAGKSLPGPKAVQGGQAALYMTGYGSISPTLDPGDSMTVTVVCQNKNKKACTAAVFWTGFGKRGKG